ncbi:hypothetical protein C8R47DRAFT_1219815 [Mycena vitilis]|nr:hypothetical protein C8R47DRAFT_1219815 [Mycena vitilis]
MPQMVDYLMPRKAGCYKSLADILWHRAPTASLQSYRPSKRHQIASMPRIGGQKSGLGNTPDNPLMVNENGRVVGSLSPVRRRRPLVPRQDNVNARLPTPDPQPQPLPQPGTRAPRLQALSDEDLYIDEVRPPCKTTERTHYECGICLHIKSHPVYYPCGHGHCYACIRKWLEHSWLCPICQAVIYQAPFRNYDIDKGIAYDLLDWDDCSLVTLSWEGLTFPDKPRA